MSDDAVKAVAGLVGVFVVAAAFEYVNNALYEKFWVKPAIDKKLAEFKAAHPEVFAQ